MDDRKVLSTLEVFLVLLIIKAREEILNIFNAETSEEAIRRLAILVDKRHALPPMAQNVVKRLERNRRIVPVSRQ
jgi:hypothetical protein